MTDIHIKIKNLREDNNLKQHQVAGYLGISQQAYSYYEFDKREIPSRHIAKLSQIYGVSADYLLGLKPVQAETYNLNATFIQGVKVKDVLISLQGLNQNNKKEAMKFLSYLQSTQ